jgi:arylsulfatase A-like enzyme/biopolymer transport protein ExbD
VPLGSILTAISLPFLVAICPAVAQVHPQSPLAAHVVEIDVDSEGRISVDGQGLSDGELSEILKNALSGKTDAAVLVRAHRSCTHRRVAEVARLVSRASSEATLYIGVLTEEAAVGSRPNVLLILVDDLGYGDLSSYGAEDLQTPHIDRLAARGMKMTSFYANCPVCSPTRASLLTGRYPDAVGVPGVIRTHSRNSWGYLSPDAVLLPALLKKAGYRTAMVGKWHLGLGEPNVPTSRGFDFFHGFLGDMMDDYFHHRRHGVNYMRLNGKEIDPPGHATDLFTRWTCDWLRDYREDDPFFLYLAYNAPHSPIQPPEAYLERYKAKHPAVPAKRAKLAALVEHTDACVGQVMEALEQSGHAANTLVLFTSDNGGAEYFGSDNGPLAGGKQDMLEGGLRVPMCAVWPGKIRPGSVSDRVALTMDLFPTVCEAAGAQVDHEIDGRSILPTLLGKSQPPEDRYLFWVRLEGGRRYGGKPYYACRHDNWKLLQNDASEPYRLFDLAQDPGETKDLAEQSPNAFNDLKNALDAHIAHCANVPWRDPQGAGPGEIRD